MKKKNKTKTAFAQALTAPTKPTSRPLAAINQEYTNLACEIGDLWLKSEAMKGAMELKKRQAFSLNDEAQRAQAEEALRKINEPKATESQPAAHANA